MITAKEAREKIENLETELGEKEKRVAEDKISAAIENNEYCCWLGMAISDPTRAYLKSLGYQVEPIDETGDLPDTKVSW